jgi:hypothetical protein
MAPWVRAAVGGAAVAFFLWFIRYQIVVMNDAAVDATIDGTRNLALAAFTIAGALAGVTAQIFIEGAGRTGRDKRTPRVG